MKKSLLILILLLPYPSYAQDALNARLTQLELKLDQALNNQTEIKDKVSNNPLGDRAYGVEVNFLRFLFTDTLSGTVSYFDHDNQAEWAFPIYFERYQEDWEPKSITYVATLDVAYRQFLGDTVNGFYLSGFSRATYIKGPVSDYYWNDYSKSTTVTKYDRELKFGVGVGIGYRIFSKKRYYWGTSLSLGKYLIGENYKYDHAIVDDLGVIFDIELLKFGYAF